MQYEDLVKARQIYLKNHLVQWDTEEMESIIPEEDRISKIINDFKKLDIPKIKQVANTARSLSCYLQYFDSKQWLEYITSHPNSISILCQE